MTEPLIKQVLVLGASGQLGQSIRAIACRFTGLKLHYLNRQQLDYLQPELLQGFLAAQPVSYIINCAAYTAVDLAEQEPEAAWQLNQHLPAMLAQLCKQNGIGLVHISTDYVFNGQTNQPYCEYDLPSPVSVYGKSKLAGEQSILACAPSAIILRTSWLYSEYGKNFLKTMLRLGAERSTLGVVADQIGSPTYAGDLAGAILTMLGHGDFMPRFQQAKIYHYANQGVASWYDFAQAIFDLSQLPCKITPITTAEYPTAAVRPAYSVLATKLIGSEQQINIPYWRHSLQQCLPQLSQSANIAATDHSASDTELSV
jgi:dTDP-4-dehydrorhamnose reductase